MIQMSITDTEPANDEDGEEKKDVIQSTLVIGPLQYVLDAAVLHSQTQVQVLQRLCASGRWRQSIFNGTILLI